MKRTFKLLPLMLLSASNICNSQYIITKENNLMRGDDRIIKQQVAYVEPGKPGENKNWDFSGITTVNEKYKLRYRSYGDSAITGTEHRTQYKYKLCNDTLYMTGYENPLTVLGDSVPQPLMAYPFSYGSRIEKDFRFKGKYSGRDSLTSVGRSIIHADAYGIITLPDADTLGNVIRVSTVNDSRIRVFNPLKPPTGAAIITDTISGDSLTRHREEICRWYAEGYRYPVFETVTHTYYQSGKPLSHFSTAFYYPPSEQRFEIEDSVNSRIRERLALNSGESYGNESRNSILNRSRGDNRDKTNGSGKESDNGSPIDNGEFTVTTKGGNVTVDYNLTEISEIEIILTDLHGRVFGYVPRCTQTEGTYTERMDSNRLAPGDYILGFIVNGEALSRKFSIK